VIADELTLNAFTQISPPPEVVELCGAVKLDFVVLDTKHTSVGWDRLPAMCLAALCCGTFPLLRLGTAQQAPITRALDAGSRNMD